MIKNMRVAILGTPVVQDAYLKKTKAILGDAGNNTGNLLFRYAIHQHISSDKEIIELNKDPNYVRENFDIIVIPSANQVNGVRDLTNWATFVEKCDLPVLPIGLGAQSPQTDFSGKIALKPGTLRYLKVISERATKIAVRGEFTAKVLEDYGITNTVVMGCPSLLINPKRNLGQIISNKLKQFEKGNIQKLCVASANIVESQTHKLTERKLIDLVSLYNGYYLCQSPQELISLSRGRLQEIENPQYLPKLHEYLMPYVSYMEFLSFVRKHFTVFFDIPSWLEFMSSCDLSLGKRIHGNMIAVQAETPGICISHDSRTKELCNTTKIPHIEMSEFIQIQGLEDLLEKVDFDAKFFDENRLNIAKIYEALFKENNIDCQIPVLRDNKKMEVSNKEQLAFNSIAEN